MQRLAARIRRTLAMGLAAWLLAGGGGVSAAQPNTASPVSVRDDRGVEVRLPAPARRIVSLLPSLTESVCALGACDRLVGVDRHSNHPPQVRLLRQVGGLDDSQVEAIVALKPDLVLAGTSARVIQRLESLGLRVATLEPRDMASAQRVLMQVDTLLGTRRAEALWQSIDATAQRAARQVPASVRGARVYVEVATGPYAASEASYVGELLARLGLRNVVPAALGPFPLLNPEFVVRADPDLIIVSAREADALAQRPGWRALRALHGGGVCALDSSHEDVLARPGPRLGEAAMLLAGCAARLAR